MSYEGSREWLCANGHLHMCDCYDSGKDEPCSDCGARTVWVREIDETNGFRDDAEYELLYPPLEVIVPAVTRMCDLGCEHVIEPARYKIPGWRRFTGDQP